MRSSPVRGSPDSDARTLPAARWRLESMSRSLGLAEVELDCDGGVVRGPQRRLGVAEPGVQDFEFLGLERLAAVEHEIEPPRKSLSGISQIGVVPPGQAAGSVVRVERGPGVLETRLGKLVVSRGPVPVQGISIKIADHHDGHIVVEAAEQFLRLGHLDRGDGFLFKMGADVTESLAST